MKTKKIFIFGIFIILGLCVINHYLFKWTNYSDFIAYIAPTNESLFQHAKMFFYPYVLYYFITYIIFAKKYQINYKIWMFLPLFCFISTFIIVFGTYYLFELLFNLESMIIDIGALIIGIIASNIMAYNIYIRSKRNILSPAVSLVLLVAFSVMFTSFTITPPTNEFFYDKNNNTYQIVYE